MQVRRHAPATFLRHAGPFLERAEAENSLVLGISRSLAEGEMTLSALPILATVEDEAGEVVLAALRTPPHNLVLSTGPVVAAEALHDALKSEGSGLPGVTGPAELADVFAERWAGQARSLVMRQRLYACTAVVTPNHPGGGLRPARATEQDRAVELWLAFNEEANNPGTEASIRRLVRDLIDRERVFVWERDGELVSIAAARQPTSHGIRVGYVYTPPAHRRQGFGTAITAGVTQRMLGAGYRMCVLYADAANPTANAIYRRIGYAPRSESAMWHFTGST